MFAVVECGGKQYKVAVDDVISVEKLEAEVGTKINLNVLLTSEDGKVKAGTPVLKGTVCEAEVVEHGKGEKITVYKYKPKKNVRRKQGHRQPYTKIKILAIK